MAEATCVTRPVIEPVERTVVRKMLLTKGHTRLQAQQAVIAMACGDNRLLDAFFSTLDYFYKSGPGLFVPDAPHREPADVEAGIAPAGSSKGLRRLAFSGIHRMMMPVGRKRSHWDGAWRPTQAAYVPPVSADILFNPMLKDGPRTLLLMLVMLSGHRREFTTFNISLATMLGVSRRTVQYWFLNLEGCGYVTREYDERMRVTIRLSDTVVPMAMTREDRRTDLSTAGGRLFPRTPERKSKAPTRSFVGKGNGAQRLARIKVQEERLDSFALDVAQHEAEQTEVWR